MNDCFAEPEQSLRSGDIIVAIERRLLVDLSEDEVEENFGAEFVDGASLVVGTFEELQHFSLQSISRRASDIVNMSAAPSEGGAVQGERRELGAEQYQSISKQWSVVVICFLFPSEPGAELFPDRAVATEVPPKAPQSKKSQHARQVQAKERCQRDPKHMNRSNRRSRWKPA